MCHIFHLVPKCFSARLQHFLGVSLGKNFTLSSRVSAKRNYAVPPLFSTGGEASPLFHKSNIKHCLYPNNTPRGYFLECRERLALVLSTHRCFFPFENLIFPWEKYFLESFPFLWDFRNFLSSETLYLDYNLMSFEFSSRYPRGIFTPFLGLEIEIYFTVFPLEI